MSNDLGDLIRSIREDRDLTLKEAAGSAISSNNLSNFEKGTSMIKADVFLQVAQNMDIDFHTLNQYYERICLKKDPVNIWIQNLWDQIKQYQFTRALKLSREIPKNSCHSYHFISTIRATICLLTAEKLGEKLLSKEELLLIQQCMKKLTHHDSWCIYEFSFYESCLRNPDLCQFSIESIIYRNKRILEMLNDSMTYDYASMVDILLLTLIASIRYLCHKKHYREAELLIYQIKNLKFLAIIPYTELRLVSVYMEEVFLYLRKNDTAGLELAKQIVHYLDSQNDLFHITSNASLRDDFVKKVHLYNTTGESLEDI